MLPDDQGLALSMTPCPFEEFSLLWPWYFCRLWVASLYVFSLACCTWSAKKRATVAQLPRKDAFSR